MKQLKSAKDNDTGKEVFFDWFSASFASGEDENAKNVKRISIDYYLFSKYLMNLGFYRFEKGKEYYTVRVINHVVEVCTQNQVVDAVKDEIENAPGEEISNGKVKVSKEKLLDKLFKGIASYFSENLLNRCLKKDGFSFLEDTKDKSYFFFKNCIAEVTTTKLNILEYESVEEKYIWKDQILDRDFNVLEIKEFIDSPFSRFISNISSLNQKVNNSFSDSQRTDALMSIMGYNLHKYFLGKLKATIFTDSTISDEPNGRTGKTLLAKAIGKVLNTNTNSKTFVELNGKNFNFQDPKRYQECEIDTKLVHLNDVMKNFKFELLFNDISEGIKAVQHYKAPFLVNAKIIISTNRTIQVRGNSAKDRCIEFEMSNYYGLNNSPEKEFGHWFFRDWNHLQWLQFDNFMLYCVKMYLSSGLIEPGVINLNKRKLHEETAREFILFMDEQLKDYNGERINKKDLHNEFLEQFPDFNRGFKAIKQRTFNSWCRLYAEYSEGFEKTIEIKSNGQYFIEFVRKGESPGI